MWTERQGRAGGGKASGDYSSAHWPPTNANAAMEVSAVAVGATKNRQHGASDQTYGDCFHHEYDCSLQ